MEERNGRTIGCTGTINFCQSPSSAEEGAVDLTGHVHRLPCCVKFNGSSNVSHYFKPKSTGIKVDGLAVEEAFFRGRKLEGVTVPLPEGYSGFILGKKDLSKDNARKNAARNKDPKISSGNENSWDMLAKCGKLTFWNHDSQPSQDDASLRLFHWLAVAKALHEPLSAEDLSSASATENQISEQR